MAKTTPIRWWRDDATRFLSRPESRTASEARHFNLSEIPRGDNPELDVFVASWRDSHGFLPADHAPMFRAADCGWDARCVRASPLSDVIAWMQLRIQREISRGLGFDLSDVA